MKWIKSVLLLTVVAATASICLGEPGRSGNVNQPNLNNVISGGGLNDAQIQVAAQAAAAAAAQAQAALQAAFNAQVQQAQQTFHVHFIVAQQAVQAAQQFHIPLSGAILIYKTADRWGMPFALADRVAQNFLNPAHSFARIWKMVKKILCIGGFLCLNILSLNILSDEEKLEVLMTFDPVSRPFAAAYHWCMGF